MHHNSCQPELSLKKRYILTTTCFFKQLTKTTFNNKLLA